MSSDPGPRPVGVRMELADGQTIPLDLVAGPVDSCGCRIWLAFGPPGVGVPDGAEVAFDEMPAGAALAVAFEQDPVTGEVRFAGKPLLPLVLPAEQLAPGQDAN